jgi:hypothetical protein
MVVAAIVAIVLLVPKGRTHDEPSEPAPAPAPTAAGSGARS